MDEESKDRHGVDRTHIVASLLLDRATTRRPIAQQIQSVTHYSVSTRTIRHRLQLSRMSARCPLCHLPLIGNHWHLSRQWRD
ncbi:hypothetical protein TNCV_1360011 [Trichonephila clavipes]|nr:hypothetical protein TNCV_1360011 [Trichonephila clavipes]